MRSVLMGILCLSTVSQGQSIVLNSVNTHHAVGKSMLELGQINVNFSQKPCIKRVSTHPKNQVQLVCSDVVCKEIGNKKVRIHETIPCLFHVKAVPTTQEVVFTMKFDPTKVVVAVDELQDTPQGVSLVIRVYDHASLQLLDRCNNSILRML